MPEPAQVSIEKLRELYVVHGLSIYAIAKHHLKLSYNTVQDRVLKWRLDDERTAFVREQTARLKQSQNEVIDGQFVVDNEGEASLAEPERSEGNEKLALLDQPPHFAPLHSALPSEDEDVSAFGRLSRRQQQFVLYYTKHRKEMSIEQMCEEIPGGANKATVSEWLNQDPDMQEAILELIRQEWKFKGEQMLLNRFDELMASGKERPEDRKLLAEIYGLTNGNTVNFNFNVTSKSPNLKNRF